MKIMITGGAGFIGSAVVRHILKNSDFSVINVDSLTYAGNLESIKIANQDSKRYFFEKIDICNSDHIAKLFTKYRPDKIMHLAAESHVDRSIENPDDFIKTNIFGTYCLLKESYQYYLGSGKEFIFHHISTDEVYGDLGFNSELFTEESSYMPSSPYSASKASSDHLVRAWNKTYDLPVIISNCSNNYGPYQFPEKLIPRMILSALNGKDLPIYGDGSQIRDWLYVEDHAKALFKLIQEGKSGETYNIGGNNEMTNLEVVKTICSFLDTNILNKPKNIESFSQLIKFVKDRPGHDKRYAIDATKIHNDHAWKPEESFESGIEKTINWYIKNDVWWKRILSGEYLKNRH